MNFATAIPIKYYIDYYRAGNVTHAASALGVDRSTLHRVMGSAYVIENKLYTIKRKSK